MNDKSIPKVVEAEEFRLVDSHGRMRGIFHARGGITTFDLRDEREGSYITLQIEEGRPSLSFARNNTEGIFALGTSEDGTIGLQLTPPDGKFRFMVRVSGEGDVEMVMVDRKAESIIWRAP